MDGTDKFQAPGAKKVGDRIILESEGGPYPQEFLLTFDLQAAKSFIAEQGLRIYMNFTGEFFPGHAFRPPLREGLNVFRVSTHGNVKQIALGTLNQDASFGIENLRCIADVDASRLQPVSPPLVRQRGPIERKLRAIARQLRDRLQ